MDYKIQTNRKRQKMKKPFAKIGKILLIGAIGVQTFSCSSTDTPELPPPEQQTTSSSSDETSQGYAFCVYPAMEFCDPGNFTACPTGGMPMNSCPYTSGGESSTSADDASSSSSTDDTLSSSSDADSSSGSNDNPSSSSGVAGSSSSGNVSPSSSGGVAGSSSGGNVSPSSSGGVSGSSSSGNVNPSSSSGVGSSSSSGNVSPSSSSSVALSSSSSSGIGVPCAGFVDGTTRLHHGKQKAQFCDARDDKRYVYVEINSQTWMAEDLAYGSAPHRYELTDAMNACPSGWRLPSVEEWKALVDFANVGNSSSMYQFLMAAQKLKANSGWNVVGTDDYGFSALPTDGNANSRWWSSTGNNSPAMDPSTWYFNTSVPTTLHAVRCIKGNPITPPPPSSSSGAVTLTCTLPNDLVAGNTVNLISFLKCSNTNAPPTKINASSGTPVLPFSGSTVVAAGNYTNISVSAECGTGNFVSGTCNDITISSVTLTCTLPNDLVAGTTVTQRNYLRCSNTNAPPTNAGSWSGTPTPPFNNSGIVAAAGDYTNISVTAQCGTGNVVASGTCNDITISSPCAGFVDGTTRLHYGKPKAQFCDERDGQKYVYETIGDQVWMAENLNYNASGSRCCGESGPVWDNQDGGYLTLSSEEIQANCDTYGRLYNWTTTMNLSNCNINSCAYRVQSKHQGVCPPGWHLPSDTEWDELTMAAGGTGDGGRTGAGTLLKTTSVWNTRYGYIEGKDDHGFSALPGSSDNSDGNVSINVGDGGHWWSATEGNASRAWSRSMRYDFSNVNGGTSVKSLLFSVRCVRN